jgi:hypothetical protein
MVSFMGMTFLFACEGLIKMWVQFPMLRREEILTPSAGSAAT